MSKITPLSEKLTLNQGRPRTYTDDTRVYICVSKKHKIHPDGERGAIMKFIVENGYEVSFGEIIERFYPDIRPAIRSLVSAGLLKIREP